MPPCSDAFKQRPEPCTWAVRSAAIFTFPVSDPPPTKSTLASCSCSIHI